MSHARAPAASAIWGVVTIASMATALFSYRYLADVGPLSPSVLSNLFRRPWLDVHVAGAATALLLGPLQFLPAPRRTPLHKALGRVYVLSCLAGGLAGLVLAFGSTAGAIATVGFAGLAISWIAAVLLGWRAAVNRHFGRHRAWMIRAFSLTFAAVTLRIYLLAIPVLPISALDAYRAISFLCWIPNLLFAELYLRENGA